MEANTITAENHVTLMTKNGGYLSKHLKLGKTVFDIFPLILIRLAWGLKQKPRKNESNMSIFSNFRTKILLKDIDEKPNFLVARQVFNQIFVCK